MYDCVHNGTIQVALSRSSTSCVYAGFIIFNDLFIQTANEIIKPIKTIFVVYFMNEIKIDAKIS